MDVYKESATGLFICKLCNKDHNTLKDAMECASSHPKPSEPVPSEQVPPLQPNDNSEVMAFRQLRDREGINKIAEDLCMNLIEDYLVSRQRDMMDKGKVSAMTLSLGKVAAEAMINLNKINSVGKNVNINMDASKKSDVGALKDLLMNKKEDINDEES